MSFFFENIKQEMVAGIGSKQANKTKQNKNK